MWPRDAYVGQKVVCVFVPSRERHGRDTKGILERNRVYTIEEIKADDWYDSGLAFNVGLKAFGGVRVWVTAACFRPVEPKKNTRSTETGLTILRGIAAGTRQPEREEA